MATPHFWYQLGVYGPQVAVRPSISPVHCLGRGLLLAALLLTLPYAAEAQRKRRDDVNRNRKGVIKSVSTDNLQGYNNRFFRPGLAIAPSFTRFFVEQSPYYVQQSNISANSPISPAFGVGFIGDIRLGDPTTPFHLRFIPGFSFPTRQIEFKGVGGGQQDTIYTQEVGGTQMDFPILIKYQSQRRRNTRVYFIGGIKPSTRLGNQRLNDPLRNQARVRKQDLTLEYGFGLDLFYPLFKFGPELRFSHGLRNLLEPRPDGYSQRLQSLRSNTVTLYLNIE